MKDVGNFNLTKETLQNLKLRKNKRVSFIPSKEKVIGRNYNRIIRTHSFSSVYVYEI